MRSLGQLVKRDCLVFIRDRAAVFFSMMSMLIVLLLMVVFLGDMNVETITSYLSQYGGTRDAVLDKENATVLVQLWTIAGILIVNAVTVTLTVIGVMVNDMENHRLSSFYTAPVSKSKVAAGYIISAILIGTFFCLITLVLAELYVVYSGGAFLSVSAAWKVVLNIVLNVCLFSVVMYLAALFVKSSGAWSGVATIVGTLVGFVGAIYLPMGMLPSGVAKVLKFTPILHGTSLMRDIICKDAITNTFTNMPQEFIDTYRETMGIDIVIGDKVVPQAAEYGFLLIFGAVTLAAVVCILHHKKINDR